jgi:hypothetical protein
MGKENNMKCICGKEFQKDFNKFEHYFIKCPKCGMTEEGQNNHLQVFKQLK